MILINVKNSIVSVQDTEPLFSGAVDTHICQFAFDESWDAFGKSAVFRIGKKIVTAWIGDDDTCELPWELLTRANIGYKIEVGVYGVSKDAEILTSVWDSLGTVRDGSELGSDAKEPSPDVYEQVIVNIQQVREAIAKYDTEMAGYLQRAESAAVVASTSTDKVLAAMPEIKSASESANASADRAEAARDSIVLDEEKMEQAVSDARQSAAEAEEWAAKAELIAGGGVLAFNGRTGVVVPAEGDYTAEMVGADKSGAASQALEDAKAYVSSQIATHNEDTAAHQDIRDAIPTSYTSLGAAPAIAYGTEDVTAGGESTYPEGTLYVVVEELTNG